MGRKVDERKKKVLHTLRKLGGKQLYSQVCAAMPNSEDTEYDRQAIKRDLDALCKSGEVKNVGKGLYVYQKPKGQKMPPPRFAAYGYRWKRDWVEWNEGLGRGRPKKEDSVEKALWGKKAPGMAVNFAEQVGVYLLHNGDRTVYVGRITGGKNAKRGLYDRLREHTRDSLKDDWNTFSWFGLLENKDGTLSNNHVPPKKGKDEELLQLIATIEAVIINGIRPRGNSRGGDIGGNRKYEQCANPKKEG